MAQPQISWPTYDWYKLDYVEIGDNGIFYLFKAKWTSVTNVDLSIVCTNIDRNRISNKGCLYLRETEWPQIR